MLQPRRLGQRDNREGGRLRGRWRISSPGPAPRLSLTPGPAKASGNAAFPAAGAEEPPGSVLHRIRIPSGRPERHAQRRRPRRLPNFSGGSPRTVGRLPALKQFPRPVRGRVAVEGQSGVNSRLNPGLFARKVAPAAVWILRPAKGVDPRREKRTHNWCIGQDWAGLYPLRTSTRWRRYYTSVLFTASGVRSRLVRYSTKEPSLSESTADSILLPSSA
jgi:hypothetical protein